MENITEPCNNCKKSEYCNIFKLINKLRGKNVWSMAHKLQELNSTIEITYATSCGSEVKIDCPDYNPIKKQEDYSNLVNSKKKEDNCSFNCCGKCNFKK